MVRGKSVREPETILNFTVKKATIPIIKLLKQAVASAQNNFQMDGANLYISKITVDEGPKLKRRRPRARGQAFPIQKKTSHITLILDEIEKKPKSKKKKVKAQEEQIEKEALKTAKGKPSKFRPAADTLKSGRVGGAPKIFRRKAF